MPRTPTQHLIRRFSRRLRPLGTLDRLVETLRTLQLVTSREDPFFLARGLELVVEHTRADLAYLVTVDLERLETQWWWPEREGEPGPSPLAPFCRWLLENPFRTLVVRDAHEEPHRSRFPGGPPPGLGALAGTALWGEGKVKALLFVQFREPHPLDRPELALLDSVAGFLARALEVETLKFALRRMENALAITRAVVEDSSIQDNATKLPNLRYLDIWMQANLAGVTGRELMTVATWQMAVEDPAELKRLRETTEAVRGGDLLVSCGQGRFLLLLQNTPKGLGHIFLLRLRQKLGERPMGATLWVPGADDSQLESVRRRTEQALAESRTLDRPALVWRLLEEGA